MSDYAIDLASSTAEPSMLRHKVYMCQKRKKEERRNNVGIEAPPASNVERRTPRAEAPCVLPTRVKRNEFQ